MVFLMTAFYMLTAQLIVPEIRERKEEKAPEQSGTPLTKTEGLRQAILRLEQEKAETDDPIEQKSLGITIRNMEKALAEVQRQDSIAGTPQSDNELDDILSIPFLKKAEAAHCHPLGVLSEKEVRHIQSNGAHLHSSLHRYADFADKHPCRTF